jgi:uncharacterized protein YndB with AHSA1/START domain
MSGERNPTVASESGRVERSVVVPAPPSEVWASLTDPSRLGSWFGAEVDIEARRGARARFRWDEHVERGAVVEEADPERVLAFRWLPFVKIDGQTRPAPWGRVEFVVERTPEGTKLTVTETTSGPGGSWLRDLGLPAIEPLVQGAAE